MAKKGKVERVTKNTSGPKEKDFAASGVEGTKTQKPAKEKGYVTGEDILKQMRERGVKI